MNRFLLLILLTVGMPALAQANGTVRITSGNGAVVASVGSSAGANGMTVFCAGGCSAPGDQSSGAATALSTSCATQTSCAGTAAITTIISGTQSAEMTVTATSTPVGFTVVCDKSFDGGTTYTLASCGFVKSDASATHTTKAALANGDLAANAQWLLSWTGSPSNVRVRVSAVTSGNFTTSLRAVAATGLPAYIGAAIANGAPIDPAGNNIGLPMLTADSATPTTGRMMRSSSSGVLVDGSSSLFPTTPGTGLASFTAAQQAVTGTAAALGSNTAKFACLRVLGAGTQAVYVGAAGVATSTGYELSPGDSQCWPVSNTNLLNVIATTTGSTVAYDWVN